MCNKLRLALPYQPSELVGAYNVKLLFNGIFTIILLRRNLLRKNTAIKLFVTKYTDLSQSILLVLLFSLHLCAFSFLIKRVAIVKSLRV